MLTFHLIDQNSLVSCPGKTHTVSHSVTIKETKITICNCRLTLDHNTASENAIQGSLGRILNKLLFQWLDKYTPVLTEWFLFVPQNLPFLGKLYKDDLLSGSGIYILINGWYKLYKYYIMIPFNVFPCNNKLFKSSPLINAGSSCLSTVSYMWTE